MANKIDSFIGEYYFLSNYYIIPIKYKEIIYPHSEAAFQAQKTRNQDIRKIFTKLSPTEAKKLGKNIYLKEDWNDIKDNIMYKVCYAKFTQNHEIKDYLLQTDDAILIERNTWHDTYWRMYKNKGQNILGKIFMKVRYHLNNE